MMVTPLTPGMSSNKIRVLECVERYWAEHNRGPSLGDIARILGLSRETVRYHIDALVAERAVGRIKGKARSIVPASAEDRALQILQLCGWKTNPGDVHAINSPLTNLTLPLRPTLDHVPVGGMGTNRDGYGERGGSQGHARDRGARRQARTG